MVVASWNETNAMVVQRNDIMPAFVIWRKVVSQLEALEIKVQNPRMRRLIKEEIALVQGIIEPQIHIDHWCREIF